MTGVKRIALLAVFVALLGGSPAQAAGPAHFRLEPGSTGQRVKDLQWLLAGNDPAAFKYRYYAGKTTGEFDAATARALKNTKWRLGYPTNAANQAVATDLFFRVIEKKVIRPFDWRLAAGNRANRATPFPEPAPVPTPVQTLVRDADYLISRAVLVHYSQRTRMQIVLLRLRIPPLLRQIYEDCSSSVTGLYWLAGLRDPNGFGYTGLGYTGTLKNHGRVVWRIGQPLTLLRPGDLIFYGRGTFSHVTMYLASGRVYSHGSERGPYNLPALYRGDAYYARRYV
jgi:hypothetical protein